MELVLDTLDGAELDIGFENTRAVRTGLAINIPAQARSDPFVLARAILESGGPVLGEPHPSLGAQKLRRIVARPASGTNDAMLQYHYEGATSGTGTGMSLLVVEDDSYLATEVEEVDPNGLVLQVTHKWDTGEGEGSLGFLEVVKSGQLPVERPRRRLKVSGLLFGRNAPVVWARQATGQVNADPWPTGSLWAGDQPDPRGYWRAHGPTLSAERYKYQVFDEKTLRPYRFSVSFDSKVYRDWAQYLIYKNMHGVVPKEMKDRKDAIKALISSRYEVGQDTSVPGITKCGMMLTANFPQIFGF